MSSAKTNRSFKRPFQPSISSYFGRSPPDPSALPTPQASVLNPTLPATIQSSLLNVGMRVRKSVPEGYKTRPKTYCASTTLTWSAAAASYEQDIPSQHNRSTSTTITGLVPYCGILKLGGHAAQPAPPPAEADLPPLQLDNHEACDLEFPSSQDSMLSDDFDVAAIPVAMANGSNKRRREDADEEDLGEEAEPVSPRSRPVSHTAMPNLDSVRRIAVPRTRRKMVGCEGMMESESEMVDVGDFGEAEFLRPVEWGEGWEGL